MKYVSFLLGFITRDRKVYTENRTVLDAYYDRKALQFGVDFKPYHAYRTDLNTRMKDEWSLPEEYDIRPNGSFKASVKFHLDNRFELPIHQEKTNILNCLNEAIQLMEKIIKGLMERLVQI